MLDKIKKWLLASFLSNLLRRLLSLASGVIVGAEILTKTEAQTWEELSYKAAAAGALIAVDLAWSWFEKKYLKASFPMK